MKIANVLQTRPSLAWFALSVLLTAGLAGFRFAAGMPFLWYVTIITWVFIAGLSFISRWIRSHPDCWPFTIWPWPRLLAAGIGVVAATVFIAMGATWATWLLLVVIYLLLLELEVIFVDGRSPVCRWIICGALALMAGVFPVVVVQVESRFADEEFFVVLQVLALSMFWLAISGANRVLGWLQPYPRPRGFCLNSRWLAAALVLTSIGGLYLAGRTYQHSFYTPQAPGYKDVSVQAPFVCGEALVDSQTYDGEEVFRRLLDRVVVNPKKGAPEYGMLALGTGEDRWAGVFRDSLLEEARANRFADPAQSMKSIQYEAALRAYYYPRVRGAFLGLFSDRDTALLQDWFSAINRRALTVEWVDWLYGLAFAKRPEGPYENQEIGAGLLALLESGGLADPGASPANRDYLRRNPRGWAARFRNTDDAFAYQVIWLQNAYFQSLYTGELPDGHVRRSFDWLLSQALPDGMPLRYNHPDYYSVAGIAYAGALRLNDPRYVWLAGRAVEDAEKNGRAVFAQPGAEESIALTGRAPSMGSCLLYGDSGLPNQVGPLAPDKIIFRDGWAENASYLLLNLRFTGWHRYKATNTVTSVYKGRQLAGDVLSGTTFDWLPEGRSLFRDKRIPRENLNGLLLPRTGLSAVLYDLTGIGGHWAQDPPQNAEVLAFESGADLDRSHTRLQGWQGWQHDRWIFFYHGGGPIAVADQAMGPDRALAALAWHLDARGDVEGSRLLLQDGVNPAEVVFLPVAPLGKEALTIARQAHGQTISYAINDKLARTVTIFLFGPWVGANVMLDSAGHTLQIVKGDNQIVQLLPWNMDTP
jgi:hypothetical protein